MNKCKGCESHAIRDGSNPDLCDVCYWRARAEQKEWHLDQLHGHHQKLKHALIRRAEDNARLKVENEQLQKVLRDISSCKSHHPDDVVSIAKAWVLSNKEGKP